MTTGKRAIVGLIAVTVALLLTIGLAVGQATPDFEDVPQGHMAETAIGWATANGITTGVGNNRFGMGQTLTRYQMVTFLCRVFAPSACASGIRGSDRFADVPADHWANFSIGWAVDREITRGVTATRFGGGETLTREQMVTFLYRAKGSPPQWWPGSNYYNDVPTDPDHWANIPIGWAHQRGITGGISPRVFGFGSTLSREETVLFLCRAAAPEICQPSVEPYPQGEDRPDLWRGPEYCDFTDYSNWVAEAVYQVYTSDGSGTAFYIGNDEWLTAAHVVGDEQNVTLRIPGERVTFTASVLGTSTSADLALLQAWPGPRHRLLFGELSENSTGHRVYSVGYPGAVASSEPSFTSGGLFRIETVADATLVLTDTDNGPGISGGPLLNECGEVIGLVVGGFNKSEVEGLKAVAATTIIQHLPALRGVSDDDFGEWAYFRGSSVPHTHKPIDGEVEGYSLNATYHDRKVDAGIPPPPGGVVPPTLFLTCGIEPIQNKWSWDSVFISTDWLIETYTIPDGEVFVEYGFENFEGRGRNLFFGGSGRNVWWLSDQQPKSTVSVGGGDLFVSQLRSAATGTLWVRIWDNLINHHPFYMEFEIDGILSVLNHLECW